MEATLSDMPWLGKPYDPSGLARIGQIVANNLYRNAALDQERQLAERRLQQEQFQFGQMQALKKAEADRDAQTAAIRFQGQKDFEKDVAAGMKPDEAFMKHGSKMTFGTQAYSGFLAHDEANQVRANAAANALAESQRWHGILEDQNKENTALKQEALELKKQLGEKNGNKLTEAQSNALIYSDRLKANNDIIAELEKAGGFKAGIFDNTMPRVLNVFRGEAFQKYQSAKHNWISAALRKESGAAIAQSEFDQAERQYFPQPGDAESVRNQKAELRALVERDMRKASGGASSGIIEKPKELPKFDSEEAARKAGHKAGDIFLIYDPGTAQYRRAELE